MPFSVTENIFLSDRLVEGECPNGDNDKARGDQCDVCGRTLDPTDLGNIRSKRDGSIPEFRKTSHFFLRLSKLENEIRDWLQSKKDWRQNVRKSESIIEAMYWYYKIVNNEVDESEEGEEKIPENIDIILDEVPSEIIFLSLSIFSAL